MQIIQELPNLADKMQKATQSHAIWQMCTIVTILFSICMLLLSFHFLGKDDKSIREDPWSGRTYKHTPSGDPDQYEFDAFISFLICLLGVVGTVACLLKMSCYSPIFVKTYETIHISAKNQLVKAAHANPKTLKVKTYADFDDRDRNCLLYKIKAKYDKDTQDLVRADYVASTKKIVIKPVSKTGRAYMRIIKYIDVHSDQPVNLKVKVLPYQISATYLDSNGKHSLVCNVDNKKIDNGNKKQTVVKY